LVRVRPQAGLEVAEPLTDVHADGLAAHRRGIHGRVFEGFPDAFEKQPLSRVEARCFAWRDPEELRVEQLPIFEESPEARDHTSGRRWSRVVEPLELETLSRDGTNGVHPVGHETPERRRRI